MIHKGTILKVADNSGGKWAKCIHIYKRRTIRPAQVGDIILVAIQRARPLKKVKKKETWKALVIRTKKEWTRKSNIQVQCDENACVLLHSINKNDLIGTRVFGPVFHQEIRAIGSIKSLLLAKTVL